MADSKENYLLDLGSERVKVVVASMAFLLRVFFSQIGIIPLVLYFKIS